MFDPRKAPKLKTRTELMDEAMVYLLDYPRVSTASMIQILESAGLDREMAVDIAVFLPMAFFRVLMAGRGPQFPDMCVFTDSSGGEPMPVDLNTQLTFQMGLDFARQRIAAGMPRNHIEALLFRSVEFAPVNKMLDAGFTLNEISIEPTEVNIDSQAQPSAELVPSEEMFDFEEEEQPKAGAWWKFW